MALITITSLGGGAALSLVASTQDTDENDNGTVDLNTFDTPVVNVTPSEATGLVTSVLGLGAAFARDGVGKEALKSPPALAGASAGATGAVMGQRNRIRAGEHGWFS